MSIAPSTVTIAIPPARGRDGGPGGRRTFAVIVVGVDRSRPGDEAIVGARVSYRAQVPIGTLLLVYGEDRSTVDGRLIAHCPDLYRVELGGRLVRLDSGTLTGAWLPSALESIQRAQAGVYDCDRR